MVLYRTTWKHDASAAFPSAGHKNERC